MIDQCFLWQLEGGPLVFDLKKFKTSGFLNPSLKSSGIFTIFSVKVSWGHEQLFGISAI
jgi:hypothetical protein